MMRLGLTMRGMATKVQVPVTLHGIDGRYATALYTAASKKNVLEKVETELETIKEVIAKDAKLQEFLATPLVARSVKKQGVSSLLKQKYSDITKNFFQVLAENGRLDQTGKIIASFEQLMTAHRKEVPVTVTSATPLDNKSMSKIQDSLNSGNLIPKGSKVLIENKVNPSILGGFIVEIGDKTIDLSVSSKINKLNRLMTEAI